LLFSEPKNIWNIVDIFDKILFGSVKSDAALILVSLSESKFVQTVLTFPKSETVVVVPLHFRFAISLRQQNFRAFRQSTSAPDQELKAETKTCLTY